MIHELQKIFHSLTKSLEILCLIEGAKPCARILVNQKEVQIVSEFLNKSGMKFEVSDFKVIKQNLQSDFYSDAATKILKSDDRNGHLIFYVSKNHSTCFKAKQSEEANEHISLGQALGYPKCCCEFFLRNFSGQNTDLTLKILENSIGFEFDFYANITSRHYDASLLSHFPCSFGCKESIKIAKLSLEMLKKNSKKVAAIFEEMLKGVVIYSMDEGVFLLKKFKKTENTISYGDILSTSKSKLYYLLSSANKLEISTRNYFTVNGANVQGVKTGIMVFS